MFYNFVSIFNKHNGLIIHLKEIHDWFVVLNIQAVSPRNCGWKLSYRGNPADTNLEILFTKVKQINGVNDDKYWTKRPPWKHPKYDDDKKSQELLCEPKGTLHVASHGEWQLGYETSSEFRQCYSTAQGELYGGAYPNPLKSSTSTAPCHTVSSLFQLCTCHGVLGKYF